MRNIFLTLILIGNFLISFSQDSFKNAITSLETELEFKSTSESYLKGNKPNENFINQFLKCSEFELLENLKTLNFNDITESKYSELFTSKWKGKWQIEFREWEFRNEENATDFIEILDNLSQSRIQFCVSKGGIMWWKNHNKIYLVTSRAYYVTYHYSEIKKAIIDGLTQ